jgi:TrpR family trp operon transcriptional repressor
MKVSEEEVNQNLFELAEIFNRVEPELTVRFIRDLFTAKEKDDIAKRWALVKKLEEGMSQRKIAGLLGISLCKITRGSRELKKPDSPFHKFLYAARLFKKEDQAQEPKP